MKLPDAKKIDQKNFNDYAEARTWLQRNGFKSKGMITEDPMSEHFIECYEKEGFIALRMDITTHPNFFSLPLHVCMKPHQIDIAEVK